MDLCSSVVVGFFINPIVNLLNILLIVAPILLVISLAFSFIKMTMNPDDKKGLGKIRNSIMACVIVFFISLIVNVVINLCGENFDLTTCLTHKVFDSREAVYYKIDDRDSTQILQSSNDYEHDVERPSNDDTTYSTDTVGVNGQGVERILSAAQKVSKIGIDGKWTYLSTGRGEHSLEESIQSKHTSCANFVCIILQESGYLPKGMTFWSDDNANLRISDKTKSALLNNFEIINVNFNSNFKLQPGDVSLMKGHTALYAGEVNGKRMWYDGGR